MEIIDSAFSFPVPFVCVTFLLYGALFMYALQMYKISPYTVLIFRSLFLLLLLLQNKYLAVQFLVVVNAEISPSFSFHMHLNYVRSWRITPPPHFLRLLDLVFFFIWFYIAFLWTWKLNIIVQYLTLTIDRIDTLKVLYGITKLNSK